jgi:hypothetical protein
MMTDRFPLTWELDSLYPNPETDEFRAVVDALKTQLADLASASDSLPPVQTGGDVPVKWAEFLNRFEGVNAEFIAVDAFVGCHAAADAADVSALRRRTVRSESTPLADCDERGVCVPGRGRRDLRWVHRGG